MEDDKIAAYMTLYTCLVDLCKIAAPMIPFMTEEIYQNLVVKDGYGPLEGMKIPPIINFAFICRYIGGKATVSNESEDVRWVTEEEAVGMVTHPLYAKRLADMLKNQNVVVFSSYAYDNKTAVFNTDENLKNG